MRLHRLTERRPRRAGESHGRREMGAFSPNDGRDEGDRVREGQQGRLQWDWGPGLGVHLWSVERYRLLYAPRAIE